MRFLRAEALFLPRLRKKRAAPLALAFLLTHLNPALAQTPIPEGAQYKQPDAVRAHYPDVPVKLSTPALAPGRTAFTSQQEMLDYLADIGRRSKRAVVGSIGRSQQERLIPMVVLSAEGLADPTALRQLHRPTVWFIGQQHGNEPAGGEAMLALSAALADGELSYILDKVTVIIVPRANPDGAALFTRGTADKSDLNRDHLLLSLPESRALHAAMRELPPDVVFDHHEFSVANRWVEKFGGVQAVDTMLLYATHPNVPADVVALARDTYKPAIESALKTYGLTTFLYHTTSYFPDDKTVSMGGNAPGIARNTFGLMNAVSFLVETRGIGIGLDSLERRVATHYLTAKAVLETTYTNAPAMLAALARGRAAAAQPGGDLIVAHKLGQIQLELPLLDPQTGDPKNATVTFQDSRAVIPTEKRPRPEGYFITAPSPAALERLRLNEIAVCATDAAGEVDAQGYTVTRRGKSTGPSINPEQAMEVTTASVHATLPAGTLYVPMRQPAAGLAAAALEPDSPGSLTGAGLIKDAKNEDNVPVLRAIGAPAAGLSPLGGTDPDFCR